IKPDLYLRAAARKMKALGVGALPIVEGDTVAGIITDRDLACFAIAMGLDLNSATVNKVMTREVVTCNANQEIDEAARIMIDNHIRRLVVLDDNNGLAGFFSVDDLVRGSRELAGAVLEAATPVH
ncbi:MAG: CBS domain-containing protein, partial [Gammaproteobacteria bacterium]|nr:CBS domain-containing protein [Gammaproteobacteria bacterium]